MMKTSLKDLKKYHLYLVLKEIFLNNTATMQELIENTCLSQPSIRNMIRFLQQEKIVREIGNDISTGGRCPTRFALNHKLFQIACFYIQNETINYQVYSYDKLIQKCQIHYHGETELMLIIEDIVTDYQVCCCVGAVEGIVHGDEYITDHQNVFEKHTWIKKFRNRQTIPIYLINDVKAMQMGVYAKHQKDDIVYLHINQVGIGTSVMKNGQLIYGHHGIAGEIGLIPYQGMSINQRIRKCQSQSEFNQIVADILSIILTSQDPQHIDISLDINWHFLQTDIDQIIYRHLYQEYQCEIELYESYWQQLFAGLRYLGIDNILREVSGETNEKV